MALTSDNSDRLMTFEGSWPILDVDKYSHLTKMLTTGMETFVTYQMIDDIFSPVKDLFTGLTISTSLDQFRWWCIVHQLKIVDDCKHGGFLVKSIFFK